MLVIIYLWVLRWNSHLQWRPAGAVQPPYARHAPSHIALLNPNCPSCLARPQTPRAARPPTTRITLTVPKGTIALELM
jgi:hypothetical protein